MEILKNYIDGVWVPSTSKETINIINPATQETLAKVPYGSDTRKDVDLAVEAASKAYKEWSQVPVLKRGQALYRLKALMEENAEIRAEIITKEPGKSHGVSLREKQ